MNLPNFEELFPKKNPPLTQNQNNPGWAPQQNPPPMNQLSSVNYPNQPMYPNVTPPPVYQNPPVYPNQPLASTPEYSMPNYFPQPNATNQNMNQQMNQNQPIQSFSKEAMAKWLLSEKQTQRLMSMIGMGAGILPIIATMFWGTIGMGIGAAFCAFFIYQYIQSNKDITYIKQKYGL